MMTYGQALAIRGLSYREALEMLEEQAKTDSQARTIAELAREMIQQTKPMKESELRGRLLDVE